MVQPERKEGMTTKRKWRDVLKVHPSAEEFPSPTPEEFKKLKDSIRKQGLLLNKIVVWQGPDGEDYLLDGRSRLDALEALDKLDLIWEGPRQKYNLTQVLWMMGDVDVAEQVIAANIIRRHLTPKQRVDLADNARKAARAFAKAQVTLSGEASPVKDQQPIGGGPGQLKGSTKSRVGEVAEAAGVHRQTARKYLKEKDEAEGKAEGTPEPKQSNPKADVKTLPTSDPHAAEVLKLLNKIDAAALSEKGWTKLDHAMERLSQLYDLKEEAK
jgi:ParB-like chromosome segregation protein Spo0J